MKRRLVNDRCDGTRWLFCGRLLIYTVDDFISPGTQWLRLHGSRVPGRASAVQWVLLQTHPQTGVSATCPLWNTEALFTLQAYPVCSSNLRARSGLVVTVTTSAFEAGCSVSKCRPRMCVRRLNRILGLRSHVAAWFRELKSISGVLTHPHSEWFLDVTLSSNWKENVILDLWDVQRNETVFHLWQRAVREVVFIPVWCPPAFNHPHHPPGNAVGALQHPQERDVGRPRSKQRCVEAFFSPPVSLLSLWISVRNTNWKYSALIYEQQSWVLIVEEVGF